MPKPVFSATVAVLLVGALFGSGSATAEPQLDTHVFTPGSYAKDAVVPSTEIPLCAPDQTPPGCYDGELLTLQSVYIGRRAGEPTIGVDPKGNAFMSAYSGADGHTLVYRSTDGGLTWKSTGPLLPGDVNSPPETLDPYVYVDPKTGRVFNVELYLACSYGSFSDDLGETWTTNPLTCGQPVNDHQTLVAAKPVPPIQTAGYPNVIYYCFNRVSDSACSRSLDGGLTWHPTGSPAFVGYKPGDSYNRFGVPGLCGGLHGHVAADRDGRIFIPREWCGYPYLAMSSDGGATWTRTQVDDQFLAAQAHVGEHHSVAVDDAGNVYYVWRDEQQRLPWLAISRDHGATFSEPMLIAPPGVNQSNFVTVTAGQEGKIAIQFVGTTSADLEAANRPWNSYMLVSTNALDGQPVFVSTTANPVDDPVHRGNCTGRCGGMLDYLDILVSPVDGRFWAAVVDTCTSAQCRGPAGKATQSTDAQGIAVRQVGGPVLMAPVTIDQPAVPSASASTPDR